MPSFPYLSPHSRGFFNSSFLDMSKPNSPPPAAPPPRPTETILLDYNVTYGEGRCSSGVNYPRAAQFNGTPVTEIS